MPVIENTPAGEWSFDDSIISTGDNWTSLNELFIIGEIFQDISRPYEVGVFTIRNMANVVNFLPIVGGTKITFVYTMNGNRYVRHFAVVDPLVTGDDVNKIAVLTCVSYEYYQANLHKPCMYFSNSNAQQMLNVIANKATIDFPWFQVDATTEDDWIIPSGVEPVDFINDTLMTTSSTEGKAARSWLMKTKEGYSITGPKAFTDKFIDTYTVESPLILANLSRDFGRKIEGSSLEGIKANEFFRIIEYGVEDRRTAAARRENFEFAHVMEIIDPFRKVYEEHRYEKGNNVLSYSLNLAVDEEKDVDRVFICSSSAARDAIQVEDALIHNEHAMNRRGFSLQDTIYVVVNTSAFMEIGLIYDVDIAADISGGDDKEYIQDPIYSGRKVIIEAKHVFPLGELATTTLTMANRDEDANQDELYVDSKLGGS